MAERSAKRQTGITCLVGAVIERIKGIPVIKVFNVERSESVNREFKACRVDAVYLEIAASGKTS